jgi:hypothetical protein
MVIHTTVTNAMVDTGPTLSWWPASTTDESPAGTRVSITTVAEIHAGRGVKLYIHPSHNVPGDTTAHERLDAALSEYKRRVAGV